MIQTVFHRAYARFKKLSPEWLSKRVRSVATAILAPVIGGYKTGFFLSCFTRSAVSKDGKPLPWYTYPSIDFLKHRVYKDKAILEFGGGQSTLWWAARAREVVTLEGDPQWYTKIKVGMPSNVNLHYISMADKATNIAEVNMALATVSRSCFDVVIIDGLYREEMVAIACRVLATGGMIICDNSEGYGIYDHFRERGFDRVDFYGNSPGVVLPHCTSVFFRGSSFVFNSATPIHVAAEEW